ncbi:hypothetical protein C8J57DRAFT_365930 [Mycena rebaudengoi]|nr:hypothetical protein C8J57DRAFT_365930 [Mycena rebaudengoi]
MAMPNPIALPAAPGGNVQLPPAPGNPPTITDVGRARLYSRRLVVSRDAHRQGGLQPGGPSETDVGAAVLYERSIVEASNPAALVPAWAQGFIATINTMSAIVNDMRVDQLKVQNSMLGDGRGFPYKTIPFKVVAAAPAAVPVPPAPQVTLQDPTQAPHNLPPLHNLDDIKALVGPDITSYLTGYGVPAPFPHAVKKRQKLLARILGYIGDEKFE